MQEMHWVSLEPPPMFKTIIPGNRDGPPLMIIFPWPEGRPSSPACRGTRTCRAYDLFDCVVYSSLWYINMNLLPLLPNGTTLFHTHYDLHEGPLHRPANNVRRALPAPWRYSTYI